MSEKLSDVVQETINRDSILNYFYVTSNLIPSIKALEAERDALKAEKEQKFMVEPLERLRLQNMVILLKDAESRIAEVEALKPDAEKWRGYLEIIDTVQKKAGEMDLHLEENPLRLPLTYLHTAMDYINEAANHIRTRNRLAEVEKLADKLCNSQLDPYDDAYSDSAPWLTMRRQIGRELKKALHVANSGVSGAGGVPVGDAGRVLIREEVKVFAVSPAVELRSRGEDEKP